MMPTRINSLQCGGFTIVIVIMITKQAIGQVASLNKRTRILSQIAALEARRRAPGLRCYSSAKRHTRAHTSRPPGERLRESISHQLSELNELAAAKK